MEHANKDESTKCLSIARRALESGDKDKAQRFAEKSMRLFPNNDAENLIKSLQSFNESNANDSETSSNTSSIPSGMGASNIRNRSSRPSHTTTGSTSSNATHEQTTLVRSITSKTCYYEILGISRSASDDDIKRAYRKLALKLHPDKNKAQGADDAFKSVSKAFTCLSDPDKRRHYDNYGLTDPSNYESNTRRQYTHVYRRGPGVDDIDPEEIFRMFFGGMNPFMAPGSGIYTNFGGSGGVPMQPRRHHHQQQQQQQQQGSSQEHALMRALLSLVPLLMLIVFNLITRASTPSFSLQRSRQYSVPLFTRAREVPFFVSSASEFLQKYPNGSRQRGKVEMEIERDWKDVMQKQCYNERLLKQRFEYYGQYDKAQKVSMASCEEVLRKFGR